MKKFTFLTEEQCRGKEHREETMTDYSVVLGGRCPENLLKDKSKQMLGRYWLKTPEKIQWWDDQEVQMQIAGKRETIEGAEITDSGIGAKPVLHFDSLNDIPTNGEPPKRTENGVLEVEYGHYPQTAPNKAIQEELEDLFAQNKLRQTKNIYMTYLKALDDSNELYHEPNIDLEYEFNGKRYVRTKAKPDYEYFNLSEGDFTYEKDDYVWIEVEPIKWLIDEEQKFMITDKIIFAGIEFDDPSKFNKSYLYKDYLSHDYFCKDVEQYFEGTSINKFMNNCWAKDILQINKEKETKQKTHSSEELKSFARQGEKKYTQIGQGYRSYIQETKKDQKRDDGARQ